MATRTIRITVSIYSTGGVVIRGADVNGNRPRVGRTYASPQALAGILDELGLADDAKLIRSQRWPESEPKEVVFLIEETEEINEQLGFNDVGERLR